MTEGKERKVYYLFVRGQVLRLCKQCYDKRKRECDDCHKEVL